MKNEEKDMILKKIEQTLEERPPKTRRYQINRRVEDFVYNAGSLRDDLKYGVCKDCKKGGVNDCEKCILHLKREELFGEIRRARRILRRNKWKEEIKKDAWSFVKFMCKFSIVAVAIFGITTESIAKKVLYEYFSYTAIYLREQDLKCLHIDYSREYIEDVLGKPKSVSEIEIENSNDSYFRTVYIDKYYTLLCYYNDIGVLLGYMIIGNSEDFQYEFYRSDIQLLKNSVSETREILEREEIRGDIKTKDNLPGERVDNNKYYYECKMQHSLGGQETCYIGFGFTDIGYHIDEIKPDMDVENTKINFITVFKEYSFCENHDVVSYDIIDFINAHVIKDAYAGLSKGDLTNLLENVDFNKKIDKYLEENLEQYQK